MNEISSTIEPDLGIEPDKESEETKNAQVWVVDNNSAGYRAFTSTFDRFVPETEYSVYRTEATAMNALETRRANSDEMPDVIILGSDFEITADKKDAFLTYIDSLDPSIKPVVIDNRDHHLAIAADFHRAINSALEQE